MSLKMLLFYALIFLLTASRTWISIPRNMYSQLPPLYRYKIEENFNNLRQEYYFPVIPFSSCQESISNHLKNYSAVEKSSFPPKKKI